MESNSTPLKMPHTKFEAISLKDVGGGGETGWKQRHNLCHAKFRTLNPLTSDSWYI